MLGFRVVNSRKKYDLKLGFSCNNDCIHCVVGGKRSEKDLTTAEVLDLVDRNSDCSDFVLTGGEPTIRPDLEVIINYIVSKGLRVHIQTNGMAFSDIEYCKRIAPLCCSILVAVHSNKEEVHDFIVKTSGAFKKTISGLRNLSKFKTGFRTQTVITRYNYKDLGGIISLIQEICPQTLMNLTYPHQLGNAYKNRFEILVSYKELEPYLKPVIDKYWKYIFTEALPICILYPHHFDVYNQDYRQLLDNIKGFDKYSSKNRSNFIGYSSIGEIENYVQANLQDFSKCEECKKCKAFDFCFGTWKEYFEVFKDGVLPLEDFKL